MVHMCKMIISPQAVFFFFKILIFWVVRLVKGQKMVQNVKKSVCCTQYLRNHISYDHHLWYTSVKWWYLHACLLFFSKFWFSKLLGGEMAKKWSKMTKNYVYRAQYLRNQTYDHHLWYTSVKWCLAEVFFIFSKTWFFRLIS